MHFFIDWLSLLAVLEGEKLMRLRNGVNTGTQNYQSGQNNENFAAFRTRRNNNVQVERGLHESFDYYDDCYFRERNQGVWVCVYVCVCSA